MSIGTAETPRTGRRLEVGKVEIFEVDVGDVEGDDGGVDVSGVSESTPVQSIFTKTCELIRRTLIGAEQTVSSS